MIAAGAKVRLSRLATTTAPEVLLMKLDVTEGLLHRFELNRSIVIFDDPERPGHYIQTSTVMAAENHPDGSFTVTTRNSKYKLEVIKHITKPSTFFWECTHCNGKGQVAIRLPATVNDIDSAIRFAHDKSAGDMAIGCHRSGFYKGTIVSII